MMMSCQNSPSSDEDEETALLVVPIILPSTRTTMTTTSMSFRSTKVRMIVIFAGMMLLLVICGGSSTYDVTPRRVPNKQSKKTTKPPVTKPPITQPPVTNSPATKLPTTGPVITLGSGNGDTVCVVATTKFGGASRTTDEGWTRAFETCYQWKKGEKYCWSKSYHSAVNFFECRPDGWSGGDDGWQHVDPFYVKSCGLPCENFAEATSQYALR